MASKQVEKSAAAKRLTKAEIAAQERVEAIAHLAELGVKPGAEVYTLVRRVSASGMSRSISCFVTGKDGVSDITHTVATILGCRRDQHGGLKVSGCGMDMCFDVVYRLGRAMFPDGGPLEHSPREAQERRAGKARETDGGYLLRKRDL